MMNPFKMLGDMNEMRKQAGTIQKALEEQVFDVGFGSVKIKITGNQNVLSVTENGIERNDVRTAINDAIKNRSKQLQANLWSSPKVWDRDSNECFGHWYARFLTTSWTFRVFLPSASCPSASTSFLSVS